MPPPVIVTVPLAPLVLAVIGQGRRVDVRVAGQDRDGRGRGVLRDRQRLVIGDRRVVDRGDRDWSRVAVSVERADPDTV